MPAELAALITAGLLLILARRAEQARVTYARTLASPRRAPRP